MRLGRAAVLTRVVSESLEPDWNETFAFGEAEVGAAVASGGRLVFEVWDRDYATLDDFMGQARPHGLCHVGAGDEAVACSACALLPMCFCYDGQCEKLKQGLLAVLVAAA